MTETMQKATEKVSREMETDNPYIKVLGEYILTDVLTDDFAAEKVLDEKKPLKGCLEAIKAKARKDAADGMAMVRGDAVYGWLREYYGVSGSTEASAPVPAAGAEKTPDNVVSIYDLM